MKDLRPFTIVFLFWLPFLIVKAQDLPFHQYSRLHGLPTEKVYHFGQDSKGYLWIATTAGLFKFNGREFQDQSQAPNLPAGEIIEVYPDSSGRVWLYALSGEVGCYWEGKFYNPENCLPLRKIRSDHMYRVFHQTKDQKIWLGNWFSGPVPIQGGLAPPDLSVPDHSQHRKKGLFFIHESGNGDVVFFSHDSAFSETGSLFWTHNMHLNKGHRFLQLDENRFLAFGGGGEIRIAELNTKTIRRITPAPDFSPSLIRSVLRSSHGKIFVATNEGLYRFPSVPDDHMVPERFLPKANITSAVEDCWQNLWVSSLDQGLFFLPANASHVRQIPLVPKDGGAEITAFYSGNDILAAATNQLIRISVAHFSDVCYTSPDPTLEISALEARKDTILIGSNRGLIMKNQGRTTQYLTNELTGYPNPIGSVKDLQLSDKGLFIASDRGLYSSPGIEYTDDLKLEFRGLRINALCQSPDGTLWLGMESGLYRKSDDSLVQVMEAPVRCIASLADILWVGTFGKGVFVLRGETSHWIRAQQGLSGSICNEILPEPDGAWVATDKGLSFVSGTGLISNYGLQDGLPQEEIRVLGKAGDTLWVGTRSDLYSFLPGSFPENLPSPLLYPHTLQVNAVDTTLSPNSSLPYDMNDLLIRVEPVSFSGMDKLSYSYRINLGEWRPMHSSELTLAQLPPDDYRIEIRATAQRSSWSNIVEYSFTIRPPFWQQTWFYLLIASAIAGLIYLFFRIRVLTYNRDVVKELLVAITQRIKKERFILVKRVTDGKQIKVPVQQLLFIMAARNYCDIHTTTGTHVVRGNIKSMDEYLRQEKIHQVRRIHRSYLINLDKIKGFKGNTLLVEEHEVPVGKSDEYRAILSSVKKKLEAHAM